MDWLLTWVTIDRVIAVSSVALAVWMFVKQRRYPGRFVFALKTFFEVYGDFSSKLSGLSVSYNGEAISGRIYFVRGYLVNGGVSDLEPNKVESPLKCTLPNGYRWIAIEVAEDPSGPKAAVESTQNAATFHFEGVLRRDECLEFDALILVPSEAPNLSRSELKNRFVWSHRISEVAQEVRWIDISGDQILDKAIEKRSVKTLWRPRVASALPVLALLIGLWFKDHHSSVAFIPVSDPSKAVSIDLSIGGDVYARDLGSGQKTKLDVGSSAEAFRPTLPPRQGLPLMSWIWFGMALLYFIGEMARYPLPFTSKGRARVALVQRAAHLERESA